MGATVEKILKEVKTLSSQERQELWDRVAAEEANNLDEWEKQIERDSNAGKLDDLLSELKDDIKVGRVSRWMKSLTNRRFWEAYRKSAQSVDGITTPRPGELFRRSPGNHRAAD